MEKGIVAMTSYAVNDKCVYIDKASGLILERCAVVLSVDKDGDTNLMYTDVKGNLYGENPSTGDSRKFVFLGHVGDSVTPDDLREAIQPSINNYGLGIKDILISASKYLKVDTSEAEDTVKLRIGVEEGLNCARIESISDFYEFGDWTFDLTDENFGKGEYDGISLKEGLVDALGDYEEVLNRKLSVDIDFVEWGDNVDSLREKYLEKIRNYIICRSSRPNK